MTVPDEFNERLDDLEKDASSETWDERQREEAGERWENDEYDPGDFMRIADAYFLFAEGYDWVDSFGVVIDWVGFIRSNFRGIGIESPDVDLPEMPTEEVREAWLTYGDEVGIDGHGLRDRHGEDWPRWYFEQLYFAQERAYYKRVDPDGSSRTWELNRDKVEDNLRNWRTAFEEETHQ